MITPQKQIKRLAELAKDVREHAQDQYAAGNQGLAMQAVYYAEGIERAMVEIAALNSIEMHQMEELRSFDLDECRARFAPIPLESFAAEQRPRGSLLRRSATQPNNGHFGPRQQSSRFRQPELR